MPVYRAFGNAYRAIGFASRTLGLGCAALGLASGCSSGSSHSPAPTTTAPASTAPSSTSGAPTTTGTGTTSVTATTIPAAATLAQLLPTTVPSGFVLQPDNIGDTGPTDFAKAVRDDVSPNARQALVTARFVGGYQRLWGRDDGSDQNFIFLYRFATPAGAQQYVDHWRAAIVGITNGLTLTPFTPSAFPGAQGLHGDGASGSVGVVLGAKGPYAVQALVNGAPKVDQSAAANSLAFAQYGRLP